MLITTVLSIFLAGWSSLFLMDFWLRSKGSKKYLQFVERTGLVISPLQIRWYTHRLQSMLLSLPLLMHPRIRQALNVWFNIGCALAILSMFGMLLFLTRFLWTDLRALCLLAAQMVGGVYYWMMGRVTVDTPLIGADNVPHSSSSTYQASQSGLMPMVPGVNVPLEHMPSFLAALVVAGVVHELGHALAAINERVNVTGFGIFVFVIYPGAFTELDTDGLDSISACKQMRIFCAGWAFCILLLAFNFAILVQNTKNILGIWHNLVLALAAVASLQALPYFASLAFMVDKGIVVSHVQTGSGLQGAAGLRVNDVVFGINYCKVYNADTWHNCLHRLLKSNYGYCVPKTDTLSGKTDQIREINGELDCCGPNKTNTHLCFYYKATQQAKTSTQAMNNRRKPYLNETLTVVPNLLPKNSVNVMGPENEYGNGRINQNAVEHSCLPARYVTDHYVCNQSLPCAQRAMCIYPALFNNTKLLRFFVANRTRPVLYIGHPSDVFNEVKISPFVPKTRYLPALIPDQCALFCKYLVTFSLALGLLNAVPCYSLDGQFMLNVLLDYVLGMQPNKRTLKRTVYKYGMVFGTVLLIGNISLSLIKFTRAYMT